MLTYISWEYKEPAWKSHVHVQSILDQLLVLNDLD